MRGGGGGGQYGLPDAAGDDGYDQVRANVVQPGHRRSSQGTDCPRNRRDGRIHGYRDRSLDDPVPDAEPLERTRHVEPARPVRQGPIFAALAPDARADTQPQPVAGQRNGPFDERSACDRGKDPHGRRIQIKSRHFDRGNLFGGSDARRALASRGRPGRRFRVARPERATRGARLRNRSHENRHAGTHRRTQRRFQPTRRAERRRKPGQVFVFE